MIYSVLEILFAFAVTYVLMPIVLKIAEVKNLYDTFDERKTHTNPTPRLGGIAIFVGLVLTLLLAIDFTVSISAFQYYIACFFVIFTLGVVDDILILSAWKKVLIQVIIAILLVTKAGLVITNLHGFIGIYEMDLISAKIFTVVTIVAIVNAFNLIDGIDGLAASLAVVSSVLLAVFYIANNDTAYAILSICMAGSLLAFLMYNFPPAKIFMGDCGSLLIGLVNSIIVIHFIETGDAAKNFHLNDTPAVGFGLILIPLMDALRVFILRVSKGQSPFAPDRNHLHHLLLNKGYSHKTITLSLIGLSLFFGASAYVLQPFVGTTAVVFSLVLLFFICVYVLKHFLASQNTMHVVNEIPAVLYGKEESTRVVSIYKPGKEAVAAKED